MKSKKIIAFLLIAVICFSCVSIAFAESSPAIYLTKEYDVANEQVKVYVNVQNNPGVVSLYLSLNYDASCFQLVSVEDTKLIKGSQCETNEQGYAKNPYTLFWFNMSRVDSVGDGTIAILTFKYKKDFDGEKLFSITESLQNTSNSAKEKIEFATSGVKVSCPKYAFVAEYSAVGQMTGLLAYDPQSYVVNATADKILVHLLSDDFKPVDCVQLK